MSALAGASKTITGTAGENIVCVKDVDVSGSTVITFTGPDGTTFVVNVSGTFKLGGSARIKVDGSNVQPSDVLYNVIGTGSVSLNTSGGIDGSLVAINRDISQSAGIVAGQICGNRNITLSSGASVRCPAP